MTVSPERLKTRARVMAAWRKRREAKGQAPTADTIQARMRDVWPTMSQDEQEFVFQQEAKL